MSHSLPVFPKLVSKSPGILLRRPRPYYLISCSRTLAPVNRSIGLPYRRNCSLYPSVISNTSQYRHFSKTTVNNNLKRPLQAGISSPTLISACALLILALSIGYSFPQTASPSEERNLPINDVKLSIMAKELPGRPGTLTPEEEAKLRQLWILNARLFGIIGNSPSPGTK